MKKIIDFLKNMLLTVVYPNRILNLFRVKNLDQNSNKILGNDNVVRVLALIGAIAFVVYVRYAPAASIEYQRTISGVLLNVDMDHDNYTLLGNTIPQHIDVILTGDQTAIELLMGSAGIRAYIDLTNHGPGMYHDVIIEITGVGPQITALANPSFVAEVEIARIEEEPFPVYISPRFPVVDETSRYRIGEITYNLEYVYVRGPRVFLDEIFDVQAILDLSNISLTSARTEHFEEPLGAIRIGPGGIESIRGVSIYPQTVRIEVEIYEDLRPINLGLNQNVVNVPEDQYKIINVTADIEQIEVWGNFANMREVIELPRVNFEALDDEGQVTLEVPLPSGVYTEINGEIVTVVEVVVTVEFEEVPPPEPLLDEDTDLIGWMHEKDEKRSYSSMRLTVCNESLS